MENKTSNTSKLALLRKAKNLTYSDLAVYLNVPVKVVEKYETGEKEMDTLTVNKLSQFFKVPPAYFIVENPEEKEEKKEIKKETLGGKILQLRKSRGLTQADLGALLNISYQAVSKWERDESCPDFDTLSKLAQYFNVSVSYFEKDSQEKIVDKSQGIDSEDFVGVCRACGMAVYTDDIGERTPQLVCKRCAERRELIRKQKAEEIKRQEDKKAEDERYKAAVRREAIVKSRNRGLIWSAVIVGALLLIYLIGSISAGAKAVVILPVTFVGILFLYPYFAQLFWDGAVVDCTLAGGKTIGTPGVIFTLDLDGIIFLIGVKILFAVIRFLIFLATVIICAMAAIFISPFTFFPALRRVSKGDLVD
ncbi:MAG: helix-turn-helix domain-containing protein [Clostridia bacterium]|nr:helix-turn-helix domain-containing protein [Clostridia bacterium]